MLFVFGSVVTVELSLIFFWGDAWYVSVLSGDEEPMCGPVILFSVWSVLIRVFLFSILLFVLFLTYFCEAG